MEPGYHCTKELFDLSVSYRILGYDLTQQLASFVAQQPYKSKAPPHAGMLYVCEGAWEKGPIGHLEIWALKVALIFTRQSRVRSTA